MKPVVRRIILAGYTPALPWSYESFIMPTPDQSSNPPGKILDHDAGLGEADHDRIEARAIELAEIAGLDPDQVDEGHRAQARDELSGTADPDAANDEEGAAAGLIESDDVPGQSGGAVAPAANATQGDDEQTIGESLYAEGVAEADHDRMVESRREERQKES